LETQILLSGDLGYLSQQGVEKAQEDIREVERMLKALIRSLESKP
jgi:four helix bundle protein